MAVENNHESPEQKTRSLELLYSVVSTINLVDDQEEMSRRILAILKEWMDASAIALYRWVDGQSLELVSAIGLEFASVCHPGKNNICPCRDAIEKGYVQHEIAHQTCCNLDGDADQESSLCLISVPVQTRSRVLGLINVFTAREHLEREEDWVVMLTSIGQNLGLVIERAELEQGSERLSRMEERTHLAHELHDSLAQTLAGVRYNLRVLENALEGGDVEESRQLLGVVESSVEEANQELRELISRFRSPGDNPGLIPSIEEVVGKFKRDTGIKTVFQNSIEDIELPGNFESQIVRIIQEALANARKHARARTVRVMVSREDGRYQVLVEDDGVGFDDSRQGTNPRDHIGLQVMRERATRINGELIIESTPSEGTRVNLTFSCEAAGRTH